MGGQPRAWPGGSPCGEIAAAAVEAELKAMVNGNEVFFGGTVVTGPRARCAHEAVCTVHRAQRGAGRRRADCREPIHEDDADRSAFLDVFGTVVKDLTG